MLVIDELDEMINWRMRSTINSQEINYVINDQLLNAELPDDQQEPHR